MFKLQISSIFNFDRAHQIWISGLLGVNGYVFLKFLGDVKYSNTNNDYNDKDDVYVSNKWWKQQGFHILLAQEQNQC